MGIKRSQESIDKQKDTIAKKYENGYVSPNIGRHISDDHKKIISNSNKGKIVLPASKSDINGFILRYGIKEGTTRYINTNKKKRSASLEHYIDKFGIETGTIKFNEYSNMQSAKMSGLANPFYGCNHTLESKTKISVSNTGKSKIRTADHNKKIGDANKGRRHDIISCPHCNKSGGVNNMKRWHFDNCKLI